MNTDTQPIAGAYAYARDTRFHNRICRFDTAKRREEVMEGDHFYEAIADEKSALMMVLGYTLDTELDLWFSGDDVVDNYPAAIDKVIAEAHAPHDRFWVVDGDEE